ncbi:YdcF family protein [Roseibium litorale]|uniref:YdcF family protein n=1 Tax=Roseibium litorale TaxID=2803841 RepID=A0ABR9CLG7_9HYPH|nr:YdcF family protein [Roseibium litorale]MBD8891690.1 YdcF family protein [Roseibium litorale]
MTSLEKDPDIENDAWSEAPRVDTGHGTGNRRRLFRGRNLVLCFVLAVFVAIAVSFFRFADRVATIRTPADPRADAIVVLTGGTDRVERAVALLVEGRAKRLLISGVHPGTTRKQLASLTAADMPLFDCCIDLDRLAMNTVGNAAETAAWARAHDFKSLLVVTSAYHLPRAQAELQDALPEVELHAYPVYSSGLHLRAWWHSAGTIRLLMREYVKYTLARARIVVNRVFAAS